MFKLYSKKCEYAIRALANVDPESGTDRFQAKPICEKAGVPESFTRKVFQSLVQTGFMEAVRGPGGGYRLTRHPDEISLLSLIRVIDGADTYGGCILGLPECKPERPCPMHTMWSGVKDDLLGRLEDRSLGDLMETVRSRTTIGSADQVDVMVQMLEDAESEPSKDA